MMTGDRPAGGLRVGVIGVGFGATMHIPAFISEGWAIAGVWSRRVERAREAAAQHGVETVHEDWRELVERDDVDAVAVATPPSAHLEIVSAALRAGKHVLCEKPFALDAAQAEQMRALAEASGLTAMVAHEFRFAPQRAHIKQLLEEGYIGRPTVATTELFVGRPAPATPPPMNWNGEAAQGGGTLFALGSHYVDAYRHWFGEVVSVSGAVRSLRPDRTDPSTDAVVQADADDTFAATFTFASGVTATLFTSTAVAPSQGGRMFIAGSEGALLATQRTPNPAPEGVVLGAKAGDAALAELPMPAAFAPFEDDRDERMLSFRLLVREFERGIRAGTSPAPNFEDGLRNQQLLDAVRVSSRDGRTVPIE
ncbi:MAG: Gfo/Idh/MocA family oxidoreductase [Dehalococcoidia bacterium]